MDRRPLSPGAGLRLFGTWMSVIVSWGRWSRAVRLTVVGALVLVLGIAGAGVGYGAMHHTASSHRSAWWYADRFHRGLDGPHGGLPSTTPPPVSSVRVAATGSRGTTLSFIHGLKIDESGAVVTATAVRTRSVYWRFHRPGYRVYNAGLDAATGALVLVWIYAGIDSHAPDYLVTRLDPQHGRVRWQATIAASSPGVRDDTVAVEVSHDHVVVVGDTGATVLDGHTGRTLRTIHYHRGCRLTIETPPVTVDGTLVVEMDCHATTELAGYELTHGTIRWMWRTTQLAGPRNFYLPFEALNDHQIVAWWRSSETLVNTTTGMRHYRRGPSGMLAVTGGGWFSGCRRDSSGAYRQLCAHDSTAAGHDWHIRLPAGLTVCPSLIFPLGVPSAAVTAGHLYALLGNSAYCDSRPTHLLIADQRTGHIVTVAALTGRLGDLRPGASGASSVGFRAGADHQVTLYTDTHLYLLTGTG